MKSRIHHLLIVYNKEGLSGINIRLKYRFNKYIIPVYRKVFPPRCQLCSSKTNPYIAYNKKFYKCENCDFIYTMDYVYEIIKKGMGMEGSWSGPDGGGYRENWLVNKLYTSLGLERFLLYGTGNTPTFENLFRRNIDVTGCDISRDVVEYKKNMFGDKSFYLPEKLPKSKKFDGIIAVEVFEHLNKPRATFQFLMERLQPNGILCGTTKLYTGGSIEDGSEPGYMSYHGHIAYWGEKSLKWISSEFGFTVETFEMTSPKTKLRTKCIFFIYKDKVYGDFFKRLKQESPLLPIKYL